MYDSQHFLIHIRLFDVIFDYSMTNLCNIIMFKADNKNTRTKKKIFLTLKPENKYTRTTLPNDFLSLLVLPFNFLVFLLLSLNMTDPNDVYTFFNKCYTSGHQQLRTASSNNFCFFSILLKYSMKNKIET